MVGERHYHQQHGFPMGTALSPDAANVFVALCEDVRGVYVHQKLEAAARICHNSLLLFARLIDDYTIILGGVNDAAVERTQAELGRRLAPLRLDWTVSRDSMATLDLFVYKADDFLTSRRFEYRTYQKPGNRYQSLPYSSMQPQSVFRSIIKSEVTRHAVNCSKYSDFIHMVSLYVLRQLSRGFPPRLLYKWVSEVDWTVRERIIAQPQQHQQAQQRRLPLYLKLRYDSVSAALGAQQLMQDLASYWSQRMPQFWDRIVVCWTKGKTVRDLVMSSADAGE